ncbi:olfactory receptor 10A4-like [Terrapene carolina triunguis]|uniref:olfactory receptor 10A4-like n=1 Tax=Terrapene triunguis TaxID=2587831 RepID=UPI000CEF98B4|nr:olfactory receptor 10A4-like [Terrapene carolina triunguis]
MSIRNHTTVSEFILVGFSNHPNLQVPLFLIFLGVYTITLTGNVLIILVTSVDPSLHSPMYFFLRNLASLEIGFTLVIVPKMLVNLLVENKIISFAGCASQLYFFFFFGTAECCLLTAMAYDRYVAICNPLRYPDIMNRRACFQLAGVSWFSGFPVATVQMMWIFSLPFCGPNQINHFFCDAPPMLELACADTFLFEIEALTATVLFVMFPFLLILVSYMRIITTILRMPSEEGRRKAFSTCSSHLVVVTLFYGTASSTYFRPKSSYSPDTKKLISLSYTVITPMLNPIIYSLRNKEVKGALRRTLGRKLFSEKM